MLEEVRDAGAVRLLHARLDCMLCRTLEGKLTRLHQAFTRTARQALACGTDRQLLIRSNVVMADSTYYSLLHDSHIH